MDRNPVVDLFMPAGANVLYKSFWLVGVYTTPVGPHANWPAIAAMPVLAGTSMDGGATSMAYAACLCWLKLVTKTGI
jgi:hypothetical protein